PLTERQCRASKGETRRPALLFQLGLMINYPNDAASLGVTLDLQRECLLGSGCTPALTFVLTFRPRATVWLWLVATILAPALTFVLIFIPAFSLWILRLKVERRYPVLGFEAG